jgi:hypothetical protein
MFGRMVMANTEIQYLKNEIKQLKQDLQNLLIVLLELKVFKITTDEDGNLIYDTGKNDKPEVQ